MKMDFQLTFKCIAYSQAHCLTFLGQNRLSHSRSVTEKVEYNIPKNWLTNTSQ